jgi:predicted nucleic acid-binding protein
MHPFVLGELACGNLRNRTELLTLFGHLPGIPVATDAEVLVFIERRVLMGRGIGFVDAHLLASIALSRDTRLWTLDKRLARVAEEIGLPVVEPS